MGNFKVLSCGSNSEFQLGIANQEDQNELRPTYFADNIDAQKKDHVELKPIKISCGGNHTVILLENGYVYSSGDNTFGQCGFPSSIRKLEVFSKIPSERKWRDISCGWEFSLLVDDYDQVYVCGIGLKGELGCGPHLLKTELCRANWKPFGAKVKNLKCSLDFTIIELNDNRLVGCGNCRKGQLGKQQPAVVNGKEKPRASIYEPEPLNFGQLQVEHFGVCRENTIVYDKNGFLRVFGKNHSTEATSKGIELLELQTMWSSYHCLLRNSKDNTLLIYSYGNNSHGQIFPNNIVPFKLKSYSVGSEHGLISDKEGPVYAWGWGEHGNCGKRHTVNGDRSSVSIDERVTFGYLNELYNGSCPVVLLACGCATSWIVICT